MRGQTQVWGCEFAFPSPSHASCRILNEPLSAKPVQSKVGAALHHGRAEKEKSSMLECSGMAMPAPAGTVLCAELQMGAGQELV